MAITNITHGREEEAAAALPHTSFTRGSATFLVAAFMLTVLAVPLLQLFTKGLGAGTPHIFKLGHLPSYDELRGYETALQDNSVAQLAGVRPRTQAVLTGTFGLGNTQVATGQAGWLFYRQGIDYLTGEGFLEQHALRERIISGQSQPNPLRGILDFKRQLDLRRIQLVVVPIPDKATIYPEKLWPERDALAEPPQNPSFEPFKRALEANGVLVYDPQTTLLHGKNRLGVTEFFPTDSHWTPQAGELVAHDLANSLSMFMDLPPHSPLQLYRARCTSTDPSDLVRLLGLPAGQQLFAPIEASGHAVLDKPGHPYQPDGNADVLLMGDSFAGLYDDGGAGMGQHLAYYLQRPIDVVSVPNGGSWAARYELIKEMKAGHDRLANKRIVIYEFVVRDLSFGDWKYMNLPPAKPDA